MRVAVVGVLGHPESSRDPATVVAGLCARGHEARHLDVVPDLPLPTVRDPDGQPGANGPPDIVLALGAEAALASSVLARRSVSPLVLCLRPADLPPLVEHDATELVLRHLPITAVVVESARCRVLAATIGAEPSRTIVIAPGVLVARPDRGKASESPARPRVLADLSTTSPADEAVARGVLERIATEVGVDVHRVTEVGDPARKETWTLVVIPGAGSDPTLPLLRAMADGLPVLTSDTALSAEVLASMRHGLLAAAEDPDEWVEKVRYVVADPALQAHLGRGARAHVTANGDVERALDALDDCLGRVTGAWNGDPLSGSTPPADRAM